MNLKDVREIEWPRELEHNVGRKVLIIVGKPERRQKGSFDLGEGYEQKSIPRINEESMVQVGMGIYSFTSEWAGKPMECFG